MVTVDQKVIPGVQPSEEPQFWKSSELAVLTSIAGLASKHKVPNSIQQF